VSASVAIELLLRERAELAKELKTTNPGAYESANAERVARQHPEWAAKGRARWRAVMTETESDHYQECAAFIVEYGRHPEEVGPMMRDLWLRGLKIGPASNRPFAPLEG